MKVSFDVQLFVSIYLGMYNKNSRYFVKATHRRYIYLKRYLRFATTIPTQSLKASLSTSSYIRDKDPADDVEPKQNVITLSCDHEVEIS